MRAVENTPSKRQIRAVLFDLGDTLLNFGRLRKAEIFAASARLTYDYLKSLNQPVGSFRWYSLRNLFSLRLCRLISFFKRRDFDALTLLERTGTKRGLELTAEQWQHLTWLWYKPLTEIAKAEPGMKDSLVELKDRGLKIGILSNTFVHACALEKHLEQFGILDLFDVKLYSYQFPFRKPDLRIFKEAAKAIGEPPESIVFVGDLIDKDIKPALKTGMVAILKEAYSNSGRQLPVGARRIAKIADLPALIEKLNAETRPN
ncbi:MAG: HAD family hydrolase [Planctomycetota bacterium]